MDNIPPNAARIQYQYGQATGYIYVWPASNKFQWSAAGNNGEEATFNRAVEKARNWIKDNFSDRNFIAETLNQSQGDSE